MVSSLSTKRGKGIGNYTKTRDRAQRELREGKQKTGA